MSFSIPLPADTEWPFPVRSVWNDRSGAALAEPPSQSRTVICLVAEQTLRHLALANESLSHWTVVRRSVGQEDGKKTSSGISNSMYFLIAPATRASDRLILLPPCILPLPADTKPERLPADGSPIPPRAIE